jgi:hypothetical protein
MADAARSADAEPLGEFFVVVSASGVASVTDGAGVVRTAADIASGFTANSAAQADVQFALATAVSVVAEAAEAHSDTVLSLLEKAQGLAVVDGGLGVGGGGGAAHERTDDADGLALHPRNAFSAGPLSPPRSRPAGSGPGGRDGFPPAEGRPGDAAAAAAADSYSPASVFSFSPPPAASNARMWRQVWSAVGVVVGGRER